MKIQYGQPFIQVTNGRVAIARVWKNGSSEGVERASNWEELEDLAIGALRKRVMSDRLEGAYPAPRNLAAMARFEQDHATDWIPLHKATELTGISASGLDHAIRAHHLDVKYDLSSGRPKRMVRASQVLERWPPDRLVGSGNRLRWVGQRLNMTPAEVARKRFWSKVDQRGPDECWPWKGGTTGSGYGIFWLNGKPRSAHRIAYSIARNLALREDRYVKHNCGNDLCCNPKHLYESESNR